jgi:hypothetical protein
MKLKEKSFRYAFEVCKFVNENKVQVQQIVVDIYDNFHLFYWEVEK